MGYLKQEHRCYLPPIEGDNDIWKCNQCGKLWNSHASGNPQYNSWTPFNWFQRWLLRNVEESDG